jgi:hypothetical protein
MRSIVLTILLLAGIPSLPSAYGQSALQTALCSHPPLRWLLNGPGERQIALDAGVAPNLDYTMPFIVMSAEATIPTAWQALSIASFTSYSELERAVEGGKLAPGVQGIMYDNEAWSFTPLAEQQNPALYEKLGAELAHAHGLLFISTPATTLVSVLAPGSSASVYDSYLSLGIAADAARYADVFEIQAQGSEKNTQTYSYFVSQAAAQAYLVNPQVQVLAGLSTSFGNQTVTSRDILEAITVTGNVVDGYWLNIPQKSQYCPTCSFLPGIAISVFDTIGQAEQGQPGCAASPLASPNGTIIPPASEIVDETGAVWTLVNGWSYRNGNAVGLGDIAQLVYYENATYAQVTNGAWYQLTALGGVNISGDPRATATSADNTTTPPVPWIVDAIGNVWTVANGVSYENGKEAGLENTALLLYFQNCIYVQTTTGAWYRLTSPGWVGVASDPRG